MKLRFFLDCWIDIINEACLGLQEGGPLTSFFLEIELMIQKIRILQFLKLYFDIK